MILFNSYYFYLYIILHHCLVFDDGDENTLKRSKLCPKGDRHFTKSNVSESVFYYFINATVLYKNIRIYTFKKKTTHKSHYQTHFIVSPFFSQTLDGLPLTHPEHFWSPVKKEGNKVRRGSKSHAAKKASNRRSDLRWVACDWLKRMVMVGW